MTKKIATVFGLAHRCPLGTRHRECPLMNIGELPLKDRYDIITKLPIEKLNDIVKAHKKCSAAREDD